MVHTTSTKVLLTTTLRPVVAQLSGVLAQGVRLLDQCLHDELTPQKMATFEGELMWFVLYGPPAANTGNFTVGGATGTGSVLCRLICVLHLSNFLNQEYFM
jgi:hypothetical protein